MLSNTAHGAQQLPSTCLSPTATVACKHTTKRHHHRRLALDIRFMPRLYSGSDERRAWALLALGRPAEDRVAVAGFRIVLDECNRDEKVDHKQHQPLQPVALPVMDHKIDHDNRC
jgi:hypothetical protein